MKYVVVVADTANLEVVKDSLFALGAKNIDYGNLNLLLVESEVPLNLAATDGVESYQETKEDTTDRLYENLKGITTDDFLALFEENKGQEETQP